MLDAGFTERRRRHRALAQPGRVLRPERPPAPRPGARVRAARAARPGDLRGQLRTARRGRRASRIRRQPSTRYCTNVHPAEDLDGVLDQLDALRRARSGEQLGSTGSASDCGCRAELAAALAATRRRPCAAARRGSSRAGSRLRTLNALPVPGVPRRRREARRLPPRLDRRTARSRYTLDCAAVLADLLPDDAARGSISTLPLGVARAVDGRRRPPRRAPRRSARRAGCARSATRHRPHGPAWRSSPSRAACSTPCTTWSSWLDARARAGWIDPEFARRLPRHLPPRRVASPTRPPPCAGSPPPACAVVKVQASAALHVERPVRPASRDARSPPSSNRATCTRRASSRPDGAVPPPTTSPRRSRLAARRRAPWRVHFHVPLHLAARAAAHRHDRRAARHRSRCSSAARPHGDATTSTSRPTPGPCCPRRRRPTTLVAGIAGELRWPRDTLVDLGLRSRVTADARAPARDPAHQPLLLLDVVGLTPRTLAHMPRLRALAASRARRPGSARCCPP